MKRLGRIGSLALAVSMIAGGALAVASDIKLASSISEKDKADGARAHPDLVRDFGGAYVGPQVNYVVGVGRKIASQSSLSRVQGDFTVTLLNSPVNNAFAIPGGYVYITRQLMALCNDEAEMAGVLGHEVGHVAAMHGQRRQKAATQAAVGGVLLQVLTGAVFGNSGLGQLVQKGIGTGAQLLTLKFSRAQEDEADELGIRYLTSAGYDPRALSSMLASLAAQSALDAQFAGRSGAIPEWASTHPDPAKRVSRTLALARTAATRSTLRNRDVFLDALDGIRYGDDPEQGVIEGNRFVHPGIGLGFTAPQGFGMTNGTNAVTISGSGGRAEFAGANYDGNLDTYVNAAFAALNGNGALAPAQTQRTLINGIPVAWLTRQANSGSGAVDVTIIAYELGPRSAYHFQIVTPGGSGFGPFGAMVQSLGRLNKAEADAVKPRRVHVIAVGAKDTLASLSARMAYGDRQQERFLVLNALSARSPLTRGQRVKIVTY